MIKRILQFTVFLLLFTRLSGQEKIPVSGMKITRSVKIKKGIYHLAGSSDLTRPVILVEGNDIVVDFRDAELKGNTPGASPDSFTGLAILVRNSKNVRIRHIKASGYKVAILATQTENLVIENGDFSYNYRPRLNSSQEKEDISDWMSYHHNEKDEWLRYGAAIYLKDCNFFTVRDCRVTGGQNALLLTGSNDGLIINNDFSFNSGIGIGMYRGNRNRVWYNRVIFNVRGYSHGVYHRGQDSAGMLVYEQSSDNIFYKNNVTHGGDGFFLWAGQTTMDSGKGGCNNNIISHNDFSYAPTNGIEVTFSSNYIAHNRIYECDHGIWGGYSYNTSILHNQFRDNRIGIAIEHGLRNLVSNNVFSGDKTAIRLWSNKLEPSSWGYPKYRDTRSAAYHIALNSFNNNPLVFNLSRTDSLWIHDNTYNGKWADAYKLDSTVSNLDSLFTGWETGSPVSPVSPGEKGKDPFTGSGRYAGRKNIRITEWGPYDFRYPLVWNTNPTDSSAIMKFDLLGPEGKWRIRQVKGVKNISLQRGDFPAGITAEKITGDRTDILIELEYKGKAFTNAWGEKIPANQPQRFYFRKFFQPMNWEVLFYPMDTSSHHPVRTGSLFSVKEKKAPFKKEHKDRLDYAWWGGIKEGGNTYRQFITVASGSADWQPGEYELSVTWDDAVRVYLDDRLVLDEWTPSRYSFDESPNKKLRLRLGGKQQFRVEHLELGGFACLSLKIKPVE